MANKHNTTQFSGESSSQSRLKSVLDIRIVPGHPQGAWVECYNNSFNEEAQEGIAEVFIVYELHFDNLKSVCKCFMLIKENTLI